jgi:hypothetical protein
MTAPLDVERLRRLADRLAELDGYGDRASELVRGLTGAELGWLTREFARRAEVCFAAAARLEDTLRRYGSVTLEDAARAGIAATSALRADAGATYAGSREASRPGGGGEK